MNQSKIFIMEIVRNVMKNWNENSLQNIWVILSMMNVVYYTYDFKSHTKLYCS